MGGGCGHKTVAQGTCVMELFLIVVVTRIDHRMKLHRTKYIDTQMSAYKTGDI